MTTTTKCDIDYCKEPAGFMLGEVKLCFHHYDIMECWRQVFKAGMK